MGHVIHAEQLLKAHAADAGHRVQTGQRQRGHAHGHKALRHIDRHAEHFQKPGHAVGEDLERGACGGGAVRSGGRAGHAERQHRQQAFQHHGAVAHLEHVPLVLHGLGGGAGGHQAVEPGHRSAGHRDEQDGEQIAQLFVGEAGVDRQIHGRMRHQQAQHRTGDHADEHEGGHVVTGLFQQPHGHDGSKENVSKGDVDPGLFAGDHGSVHADGKRAHRAQDAHHGLLPAGQVVLFLDHAKDDGKADEQDGDGARRAVGVGSRHHDALGVKGVEGARHHVRKGGNDQQREQPAEQQEHLAAEFADVLFDQQAHGFALVLDAGVQCAEVGDSAEEDAADQDP